MSAAFTLTGAEQAGDAPVQIRRIREALSPLGDLDGLVISRRTADGTTIPVLRDGQWGPKPLPLQGMFSHIRVDSGSEFLVRDESPGGALLKPAEALIRATLYSLELEKREERLLEELGANWESLEALYEISTNVFRSGDIGDALKRLVDRLISLQEGLHAGLFLIKRGMLEPVVNTEPDAKTLAPNQLGPIARVMSDRQIVVLTRLLEAPDPDACWSKAARIAAAPITSPRDVVGFVAVWREDVDFEFDSPLLRVLEAISYQASILMESDRLNRKVRESELLAKEIEIASSIQQTLLLANAPKNVPGMEIAAFSAPSQHIDGDFHDFFEHPHGAVDVVVGDVMGKGVAAALLGAATKSQLLRSIANLSLQSSNCAQPANIVRRAASHISGQLVSLERFVTLFYAGFDTQTEQLHFVNCGHTAAILNRRGNAKCVFLQGDDLPLGVFEKFDCQEHAMTFRAGDTFLFYSDGVTENRSPEGEFFGTERLVECLQNWSSLGPALLVKQIHKEAVRFSGSESFSDDFTCIAVRFGIGAGYAEPLASAAESFHCDSGELARLREWLSQSTAAANHLGEEAMARMKLACTELFANCACHARQASCASRIEVESFVYGNCVTIRIRHHGPKFDPLSVPPPVFDGSKEGGFGTYIVLRSADAAAYEREPDGTNVITVSFIRGFEEDTEC